MMRLGILLFIILFFLCEIKSQKIVNFEKEKYNIGITSLKENVTIISKDLINLTVEYTFLTTISEDSIENIHKQIGANYNNIICIPVMQAAITKHFETYKLEEIIGFKREEIENKIINEVAGTLQKYNILLKAVFITNIELPEDVKLLYERKLISEQNIFIQENILKESKLMAEKSKIEAETKAKYNQILDSSLTEKILQMKYIEALSELAKSQNAKIIVLSDKKLELPEIINEGK